MVIRFIGELYHYFVMIIIVAAVCISLLYNISEAIEDFKQKRKEKKENKNQES